MTLLHSVEVLFCVMILVVTTGVGEARSKKGSTEATCELAKRYLNGDGVEQNYGKALQLYLEAAKAGSANAQSQLGIMYSEGKGTNVNCNEAVKWYNKAVQQNYSKAKYNLGVRYYQGQCVNRDVGKALNFFKDCSGAGIAKCMSNVGIIYKNDYHDTKKAFPWFLRAAEHGDVRAQTVVGSMYWQGEGVNGNPMKAMFWLEKAANAGDETAIDILRSAGSRY